MRVFKSSLLNRKVAGGLTRDVAMKALKLLGQKLGEANRRMAFTLIGGGVMLPVHKTRLDTRDLDAIPHPPGCSDIDLLAVDDWAMAPLADGERRDFLEICENRYPIRAMILTSQLPVAQWHEHPALRDDFGG